MWGFQFLKLYTSSLQPNLKLILDRDDMWLILLDQVTYVIVPNRKAKTKIVYNKTNLYSSWLFNACQTKYWPRVDARWLYSSSTQTSIAQFQEKFDNLYYMCRILGQSGIEIWRESILAKILLNKATRIQAETPKIC